MEHLRYVPSKFVKQSFRINQEKCAFGKTRISYLGHIIWKVEVAIVHFREASADSTLAKFTRYPTLEAILYLLYLQTKKVEDIYWSRE